MTTEPTPDLPRLAVAPHEAARMLGVSQPTLRAMRIPKVWVGKSKTGVRYSVDVLRQWLIEHSEPAREANPAEAANQTHP